MNHATKRIYAIGFLVSAVIAIAGCSNDDPKPTDDGKESSSKAALACNEASYKACAQGVVSRSGITGEDAEALSGCEIQSASPVSSKADLFEVTRAAVEATCLN